MKWEFVNISDSFTMIDNKDIKNENDKFSQEVDIDGIDNNLEGEEEEREDENEDRQLLDKNIETINISLHLNPISKTKLNVLIFYFLGDVKNIFINKKIKKNK